MLILVFTGVAKGVVWTILSEEGFKITMDIRLLWLLIMLIVWGPAFFTHYDSLAVAIMAVFSYYIGMTLLLWWFESWLDSLSNRKNLDSFDYSQSELGIAAKMEEEKKKKKNGSV